MKILLILLKLVSGPVLCFDVIGFPGGRVLIYCKHQQYGWYSKYFCGMRKQCTVVQTENTWVHEDRVSLYDSSAVLTVFYRDLSVEDAGSYQCGETGVWSHDVNLIVKTDSCCWGSKTVIGYLGETATITCSYPEEFQTNYKAFYKWDGQRFYPVISTTQAQIYRFSTFDDRRSNVVRMRISDVREDDGGVYSCAVEVVGESIAYYTRYTKIQLKVQGRITFISPPRPSTHPATVANGRSSPASPTVINWGEEPLETPPAKPRKTIQPTSVTYRRTSAAPTVTISAEEPSTPGSSTIIIITVSICVVLLLSGGLTLIFYRLRGSKTEDYANASRRTGATEIIYENDLTGNQNNIRMIPNYQNLTKPNSNQSDSGYQSLNPRSRDSNAIYHTLNPNTNQIQSVRA